MNPLPTSLQTSIRLLNLALQLWGFRNYGFCNQRHMGKTISSLFMQVLPGYCRVTLPYLWRVTSTLVPYIQFHYELIGILYSFLLLSCMTKKRFISHYSSGHSEIPSNKLNVTELVFLLQTQSVGAGVDESMFRSN